MASSRSAEPARPASPARALLLAALVVAHGCATAAAVRRETRAQQPTIEQAIAAATPAAIEAQMNRRFFAMMLDDARGTEAASRDDEPTIASLERSFEDRVGMTPVEVLREAQRRAAASAREASALELLAVAFGGSESEGASADALDDVAARSVALLQRRVGAVATPVLETHGDRDVLVVVEPAAGASARAVLASPEPAGDADEASASLPDAMARDVARHVARVTSEPRAALGLGVRAVIVVGPEMALVARDDDQLACLVGHELAHVALGHPRAAVWLGAGQLVAGLAGASAVEGIPLAGPLLNRLLPTEDLLGQALVATPLRVAGRERAQEFDADRLGQELAARAGHDPAACAELVLETARHASAAAGRERATTASYWSTHPPSSERVLALRERADAMDAAVQHVPCEAAGCAARALGP
jgi:hypothetical protein